MSAEGPALEELTRILDSDPEQVFEQLKKFNFVPSTQAILLVADACRSRMFPS
jgi:hypothetical protein